MRIQTAGEQIYYDFIKKRAQKHKLGMIMWISLLSAALIASFERIEVGLVLGVAGLAFAIVNVKTQRELKAKVNGLENKADFFLLLSQKETLHFKELPLVISKGYVLCHMEDIIILALSDIKGASIESVDRSCRLVLTGKAEERYVVASCEEDSGKRSMLEQAYRYILPLVT